MRPLTRDDRVIGVRVTVPVACWRRGLAREFLESDALPPPSTCYGALLALVGEADPTRHVGVRVSAGLLNSPETSVVLRSLWRIKNRSVAPGREDNVKPDFQQLRIMADLVIFLDAGDDACSPTLEERVRVALVAPRSVDRFGGWSLGESTHLINDAWLLDGTALPATCQVFVTTSNGRISLPTWVDHVGTVGSRHASGELRPLDRFPDVPLLPRIGGNA